MHGENDELIASFVAESNEHLADIENQLMEMEEGGADADPDLVNTIFRAIHSTKGTAGFLGLTSIGALAHEAENILNLIRNHELVPTSAIVDILLRAVDLLRSMVNDVASSNDVDVSSLCAELVAAVNKDTAPKAQEELNREVDIVLPSGELTFVMMSLKELVPRQRQGCHIYVLKADLIADVQSKGLNPIQFLSKLYELGELVDSYASTMGLGDLSQALPESLILVMLVGSSASREELSEKLHVPLEAIYPIASSEETDWGQPAETPASTAPTPAITPIEPEPAPHASEPIQPAEAHVPTPAGNTEKQTTSRTASAARQETSLRVNVDVLDKLMNLAGELVLGRNQLLQLVSSTDARGMEAVAARLDQVTSELQEAIMQTRMQAVGTVFNRFVRIVRDLSTNLGKQCTLTIEGKQVELDKAIIEAIGDPLTHLIRNSVDHGVETPAERTAKGKDATGLIHLSAFHQGGKVNIRIRDDGAGIDGTRLREKAVEKGIITKEQATGMSEMEAVRLIFHPGFSMAQTVTSVSGRGVGMDVVKTNIEKLGGVVDIETKLGVGTTINIKLPLTLAIIPSMIVRSGDDRFAIPQVNISELVRIKASQVIEKIERVKDAEVLRLRGNLLPLVRLNRVLKAPSKYLDPIPKELKDNHRIAIADRRCGASEDGPEHDESRSGEIRREDTAPGALNIIVVEAGTLRYGLIVDALHDSEEIVVKPLGRHMKGCGCLSGATILGDGAVALILDVAGIATDMQLTAPERTEDDARHEELQEFGDEAQSVLLFTNDPTEQFGAPMELISRIERIRREQIDSVGGQEVLQYRGTSLPLLSLENLIQAKARPDADKLCVVVFRVAGREVGLVAPCLDDIKSIPADIDTVTFREPGVLGSCIVEGKTMRLIDLVELVSKAHGDWFIKEQAQETSDGSVPKILLAEDSTFFRSQMSSFLEASSYEVIGCEDGLVAWNTLQDSAHRFDLVVTDIEMPNMSGLELTRKIKGDPSYAHLPIVAVTSLASEEDIQRGMEAGVNDYQIKMDREKLMGAVTRLLKEVKRGSGSPGAPTEAGIGS